MRTLCLIASLLCLASCNGGSEDLLDGVESGSQSSGNPVATTPTSDPNTSTNPNGGATKNPNDGTSTNPNNAANGNDITCPGLGTWDPNSGAFEAEVLVLVNQQRAQGANCHTSGVFAATTPLSQDANLVCLARSYSKEMVVDNFFSHTDPNGLSPFDRMAQAGVKFSNAGENIAEGYTTPQAVVTGWMNSDGHCANIMGNYTLTGIGFYQNAWTEDFITPP